jgi:hypothetical protein
MKNKANFPTHKGTIPRPEAIDLSFPSISTVRWEYITTGSLITLINTLFNTEIFLDVRMANLVQIG